MEMLISSLKEIIANVRIIDSNTIDTTKVSMTIFCKNYKYK
jgi:hypothetical protein